MYYVLMMNKMLFVIFFVVKNGFYLSICQDTAIIRCFLCWYRKKFWMVFDYDCCSIFVSHLKISKTFYYVTFGTFCCMFFFCWKYRLVSFNLTLAHVFVVQNKFSKSKRLICLLCLLQFITKNLSWNFKIEFPSGSFKDFVRY